MRRTVTLLTLCSMIALTIAQSQDANAALTPDQRRALSAIRKDAQTSASQLRKKEYDEAEKVISNAESRLQKLVDDQKLDTTDSFFESVAKYIIRQRETLDKAKLAVTKKRGNAGVSFSKEVAPILAAKCVSCHSERRSSGGLSMENFAGMKKGGNNAPVLVVGNPNASLIAQRLIAQGNQRMPRNGNPLSVEEIQTIARWIAEGAKYDAEDEAIKLSDLGKDDKDKSKEEAIVIAEATGSETVSFTKDIAPFMANLCVRCHNARRSSGGLSVATFEDLMIGGDSGRVVVPGNIEASRLWDLVGKQDPIKMPQGQARITKTNWNNLRTWIQEGAKFDGGDAKLAMNRLVPSESELKAEELAMLTPEEFEAMREKQTEEMWKRVLPRTAANFVKSKEFYVFGDAPTERLEQIDSWAEEHAKQLRSLFAVKEDAIWKGRLTIFVFRERFGYTEFNQVINNRQTAREVTGHSVVTPSFAEAYVAMQDFGDDVDAAAPNMQISLIDHITGAFLKRSERALPEWAVRGTGLAMAATKVDANHPYFQTLRVDSVEALEPLAADPTQIFVDGKFSPSEIPAVGYSLVDFMLKAGNGADRKFGQFVTRLQSGESLAAATKGVYQADTNALATAFMQSIANSGKKR